MITAVYSGDANFLISTSTSSAPVAVAPLDFTFTSTGASADTVAPGAVATYSFSLSPLYGTYASPLSFTVTGLPASATASFTPSTVAANSGAATVVLSVQTSATIAQNNPSPLGRGIALALLLLPFGVKRSLRRKLNGRLLLVLLLLAGGTAAMSGCGSNHGPQTQTLTVNATSGALLVHSQTVTLTEQ